MSRTVLLASVAWAVATTSGCSSAESRLAEAERLARTRDYDGATAVLTEVMTGWPDSPEATAAVSLGAAVTAAQKFEEGDYEGARTVYGGIKLTTPDRDPTAAEAVALDLIGDLVGPPEVFDLGLAYQESAKEGPTDAALRRMLDVVVGNEIVADDKGLKAKGRAWACEHVKEFPAFATCSGVDANIAGLDLAPARGWVQAAEVSCGHIARLDGLCEGDAASAVAEAVGPTSRYAALRSAVKELESTVEGEAENRNAEVRVWSDKPIILGDLQRVAVDNTVWAKMNAITYCYQREILMAPDLAGSLTVKLTVGSDGATTKAEIKKSTLPAPPPAKEGQLVKKADFAGQNLEACVVAVVEKLKFPSPEGGGIAIISYPLFFGEG